jgi:hypothetical protein
MKPIFIHFILALVIVAANYSSAFAQLDDSGRWKTDLYYQPLHLRYESYSESDFAGALTTLTAVNAERSSMQSNDWAGDYHYLGELYMGVLRYSPNAGFVRIGVYTCQPEVRRLDFGSVKVTPNNIQFFHLTSQRNGQVTKFVPVKWGERHYLIAENELPEFYYYVSGYGWKPEYQNTRDYFEFFLRAGDRDKPFSGLPVVPRGYEHLARKPIEATVLAILKKETKMSKDDEGETIYTSETTVKLNVGSADGVKRDMVFNTTQSGAEEGFEIVRIGKHTSTAVLSRELDDAKRESYIDGLTDELRFYPRIEVGWKLSTQSLVKLGLKNY